jgi:3-amino-4-hydroxybenzoic acid synthase
MSNASTANATSLTAAPRSKNKQATASSSVVAATPAPLWEAGSMPSKNGRTSLWYDTKGLSQKSVSLRAALLARVSQGRFNGVLVHADELAELAPHLESLPSRFTRLVCAETISQWEQVRERISPVSHPGSDKVAALVIASHDITILSAARTAGFARALRVRVDDAESLHRAIFLGRQYEVLMIAFKDTTNIPLELVIAELHTTSTLLLKETGNDVDDAVIALGVLEMGSDGVLTAFREFAEFDRFAARMDQALSCTLQIDEAVIVGTRHLGLGYRACIDTTHLFDSDEGMLVGSTSTGGLLCCPEVFHLPYMELRPFRVNAASIHSYVFLGNGRTAYISELRVGAPLTAVHKSGRTREIYVGRSKIEIRPLILIEAEGPNQQRLNIIMQDDWHVRVFSHECKPLNVTELRPGDRVLGHFTRPGRHVGIQVDEHIIEH